MTTTATIKSITHMPLLDLPVDDQILCQSLTLSQHRVSHLRAALADALRCEQRAMERVWARDKERGCEG